jgi:carbon starvation protein
MSGSVVLVVSVLCFVAGYRFWGRKVAGWLGVDPGRPTPACTRTDGVDYVPTRPSVLLGHHFSSIAGAAPIIGPIAAASYGWTAVLLWILVGGVFMGAVHDFSALIISVRHDGRGLGAVLEERVGRGMKSLFLLFVFSALILVIGVFTNAVAMTFVSVPETATASLLFIALAVGFGLSVYRLNVPFVPATVIGVALLAACMVLGYHFPLRWTFQGWRWVLVGYIFLASTLPVQYLLQPRDFLNSFILYAMLVVLVGGLLLANPELRLQAAPVWSTGAGPLFPLLFVTVACGALSGFHSLVASGTTSKQLASEAHAQPIGFGGMLIESLLAVAALITAAVLSSGEYAANAKNPIALFSTSAAELCTSIGLPVRFGRLFMSLSVAAFAMTSLDTATRLGRYALQELFESPRPGPARRLLVNRYPATGITVAVAALLVFSGSANEIWPVFGAANQLVAALAFLTIAIWLVFIRRPSLFALIPGAFIYLVTMAALAFNIHSFGHKGKLVLAVISAFLLTLALVLGVTGVRSILRARRAPTKVET